MLNIKDTEMYAAPLMTFSCSMLVTVCHLTQFIHQQMHIY